MPASLLANGDFSAGGAGWTLPGGARVEAGGYGGGPALRGRNAQGGYSFASQSVALDGGRYRKIHLEGWMRWANVVLGANSWEGARMHLTFHDASGKQLGGWPDAGIFSGISDWRLVR